MPVKLIDLPVISTQKTSCMHYNETVNHRILTAAKEKNVACRGTPIRQSDFSAETPQARTEWNDIAEVLKDDNCRPAILRPAESPFRCEGEIRAFPDKQKLSSPPSYTYLARNAESFSSQNEKTRISNMKTHSSTETLVKAEGIQSYSENCNSRCVDHSTTILKSTNTVATVNR